MHDRARAQTGTLLAKGSALNLAGYLLPMIVALFSFPVLIRGLGTERFGVLSLAWVLLGYIGFLDMGLGRAATKYVAQAVGREEQDRIPGIVWNAVLVQSAFSVAGAVLWIAVTPLAVTRWFSLSPAVVPEAETSFYLLGLAIPIVLVANSFRGVLEAAQRFDLSNLVRAPASAANFLLPVVALLLGWGVSGMVGLLVISWLFVLAAYFVLCCRVFPGIRRPRAVSGDVLRPLVGFGGWVMLSGVTIPLLTYAERWLIASLQSVEALGVYAAPYDMVFRLTVLAASISPTLFAALSALPACEAERSVPLVIRPTKYLVLAMAPVTALLVAYAEPLLYVWLGAEIAREGAVALQLLAGAVLLNSLAYLPLAAIQGLGRPDLKAKLDLFEVPLFVLLCIWWIPSLGIAGAALAKLCLHAVDLLGLTALWARVSGVPAHTWLRSVGGALLLAAFLITAVVTAESGGGDPWIQITISVLACGAFVAAYWRLVLDSADHAAVAALWGRVRRQLVPVQP